MAFEASTILQLIILLTWNCLSTTPPNQKSMYFPVISRFYTNVISPIFAQIIGSQIVLEGLLSAVSLVFAPGLFEIFNSATPPTVAYFKSLPTDTKTTKRWAVYLILLEKLGCQPQIYIGIGTSASQGVSQRLSSYSNSTLLPQYVRKALDDGYIIVHKGFLCWIPIPSPALQPSLRVLFVALEATFAYIFWAMRTITRDYGIPHMCPWTRATLEYDGLCSHSALIETVPGDHNLTAEALEAQAAEIKERFPEKRKEYSKRHRDKTIANQTYYCAVCDLAFSTGPDLAQHNKSKTHIAKSRGRKGYGAYKRERDDPEKTRARTKRHATIAKANQTHYCAVCDHAFTSVSQLAKHKTSKKHIDKAAAAKIALGISIVE
jgi:hypothetical protein